MLGRHFPSGWCHISESGSSPLELCLEAKFSLDRFHFRWSREAMEALEMKMEELENQQDPENPQNSDGCKVSDN